MAMKKLAGTETVTLNPKKTTRVVKTSRTNINAMAFDQLKQDVKPEVHGFARMLTGKGSVTAEPKVAAKPTAVQFFRSILRSHF